jgi:hypothetical protein
MSRKPLKTFYGLAAPENRRYIYPDDHPCHGCVYTFGTYKPSCIFGSNPVKCFVLRDKADTVRRKSEHGEQPCPPITS